MGFSSINICATVMKTSVDNSVRLANYSRTTNPGVKGGSTTANRSSMGQNRYAYTNDVITVVY